MQDEPTLPAPHRSGRVQRRGARPGAAGRVTRHACAGGLAIGAILFVSAAATTPAVSADAGTAALAPVVAPSSQSVRPAAPTSTSAASASTAPSTVAAPRSTAPADVVAVSRLSANGIPEVALNAYRVAAARVDHSDAGCGIDWSLLAGIGRVESDHGRFAGSTLRTDGTSTPPIVGPALTGTTWEYFPASAEYIAVTGDKVYAHALGPMQFIPSTWRSWGADADGDGKADIFDVNDAALAAARYLCAAGGNLTTRPGRVKALLAYNRNAKYGAEVLALADAYKRGVPITGIPLGDITGSLPTVGHTGALPPVNPGAPPAGPNTVNRAKRTPTPSAPTTSRVTTRPARPGSSSASTPRPSPTVCASSSSASPSGSSTSGASSTATPRSPTPTPTSTASTTKSPTPSRSCTPRK